MKKGTLQILCLLMGIVMVAMSGCASAPAVPAESPVTSQPAAPTPSPEQKGQYDDGTYTGNGLGMGGSVAVTVTVAGGKIAEIIIGEHKETAGIADSAIAQMPQKIIDAQTYEVDGISGATMTSGAIKDAVKNALIGETEATQLAELAIEPDIIVVGGGLGGLASALRASELGAKVALFEKSGRLGACGYLAGGSISGAGYKIQKAAGIEDTPEKFFQDFVDMGGGIQNLNEVIARKHSESSGAAIDWLQDFVGVEMSDTVDDGSYLPMNTKRVTYTAGGSAAGNAAYFVEALIAKLDEYIAKGTVQVLLNTEVDDIILNDKGEVTGVVADGREYLAPSTILATGGYGFSEEWLKEFAFTNVTSSAVTTATGSGYDFARKAGGIFDNMDYCAAYAGAIPVTGFQASLRCNVGHEGVVWINTAGDRVLNEPTANSGDRDRIWRTADQNIIYIILSESMLKEDKAFFSGMLGSTATYENKQTMNELIEKGFAFKADTIEELASMVNAGNLTDTLTTYNADVKKGKDSKFGRTDNLVAFEEGPFYAVYTVPYILMTQGGPRIDADGQLVREDGSKIANIYLAGEIVGSANIAGYSTIGGIGNGACITWGRISAESAAKNANVG